MSRTRFALTSFGVALALTHCRAPKAPQSLMPGDAGGEAADGPGASATWAPEADAQDAQDAVDASSPDASRDSPSVPDADSGRAAGVDAARPECKRSVLGQSARRASCTRDDQCLLRPAACCPPCGALSAQQVRAVDSGDDVLCTSNCPACASGFPSGLSAECVNRRCVVVETRCDVTTKSSCPRVRPPKLLRRVMPAALASCSADAQCALMAEDCCYCGVASGDQVIAVDRRKNARCKTKGGCPDCLSEGIDDSLQAACVGGRCRVRDLGLDPRCNSPLYRPLER